MYEKDYILRMIEMLGEFVAAIFGQLRKGDIKQAYQSLDRAYHNLLKEDASFFQKIPKNRITDKLVSEHNYTNNHLEVLAELFYAEAELKYTEGSRGNMGNKGNKGNRAEVDYKGELREQDENIDADNIIELYEKSLILFEFIDNESHTFSLNREARQMAIRKRLAELKG